MDPSAKKIKLDDSVKNLISSNVQDLLSQTLVTDLEFNKTVSQKLMGANPITHGKTDIGIVINEGKSDLDALGLPAGAGDAIGSILEKLAAKQSKMIVTMSSYLLLKSQQMSVGYGIRSAHLQHLNSVALYTQQISTKSAVTLMIPSAVAATLTRFFENNVESVKSWFLSLKCWSTFIDKEVNPMNNNTFEVNRMEAVLKKIDFNSDSSGNLYYHIQLFDHGLCQRAKQLFFEERASEPYNKIFINFEVSRKERMVCKKLIDNLRTDSALVGQTISRVSFSTGRLGVKAKVGMTKKEYAIFSLEYDSKIRTIADYHLIYNQEQGSDKNYVIFNGECVLVP